MIKTNLQTNNFTYNSEKESVMHGGIRVVLDDIKNKKIRYLTEQVICENYDLFVSQPAACGNHHAYPGGLLVHSLRVASLGGKLCDFYDGIYEPNRDIVVAGGLLHDIGKVYCYKVKKNSDGTDEITSTQMRKYHHHIPIGYHLVLQVAEKIMELTPDMALDEDRLNRLLHIIISHHGRVEYRSNVAPKTEEAFLVHTADTIDAYLDADDDARRTFNK